MSNYPAGAEYNSNAPFNQNEELQGEEVYVIDYVLNEFDLKTEASMLLVEHQNKLIEARKKLEYLIKSFDKENYPETNSVLNKIKHLIAEPEIFIENE